MENFHLIELSSNEMLAIEGGKSLAYYLGYGVGYLCGEVVTFLGGVAEALRV
jgi:hypothetical protein